MIAMKTAYILGLAACCIVATAACPSAADVVRISAVSQVWSDAGRTLPAVLAKLDEAAAQHADLALLPQECVKTDGQPIPGPVVDILAARAKQHRMYVVACLREKLLDRAGKLLGKYRKSHKMPDESMALGDELPVFPTDFGPVALRIGTDRFFPEIDMVYAAKGAVLVLWSQMPEPVEDEHAQDFPMQGRASDLAVAMACARYATAGPGWITNFYPPYCGSPIGRAFVVNREGQKVACTSRSGGVATATLPRAELAPGRAPSRQRGFAAITAPLQMPSARTWGKRKVRISAVQAHVGIDELLAKLDEAGRLQSDIVCTYEFVWISGPDRKQIDRQTPIAKKQLEQVAAKARQHKMYVLIAGVIDRIERNEAILYDRQGKEAGRYFKVIQTHPEQICGDAAPVFETDFGRIAARICADEWLVELDRSYAVQGVDILFTPTQSWGPDAIFRKLRDMSRAMDGVNFLVECTHLTTETTHRSMIVDPTGMAVAQSEYRGPGLLSAMVDLDGQRPLRYLRVYDPHTPGGYLPEYQPAQMPRLGNDLRETILRSRRPGLYQALAPAK
jgi:predicted amidohydrolase